MALDLSTLQKPLAKPPQLTIVGTPGAGKSTLAALFPAPVIVQAEESTGVFDSWPEDAQPFLLPQLPRARVSRDGKLLSTKAVLLDQLRALAEQEHDFQTVILDTVTTLHAMFEHEVCAQYDVDNIAEAAGGYGKGYLAVREMHADVKNAFDVLRSRKGMTVIFLAHAGIKKMKNRPDADEYSVYSLDMHDASIPSYTNLVDGVLYIRQEEFIKGAETDKKTGRQTKLGRIAQTGNRILVTSGDGKVGYVNAKNRFSLDSEIPLPHGTNPLLDLIPYFTKKAKAKPEPKPEPKGEPATQTEATDAQA
ncbi:MAG: AAA family ATPase [Burkholderiaceae bacterium]